MIFDCCGRSPAVEHNLTGGVHEDAAYLSAQKAPQIKGSRFQTENVNKERQKGTCSPSGKGQKATFLLITDWVRFGEKQNLKGK